MNRQNWIRGAIVLLFAVPGIACSAEAPPTIEARLVLEQEAVPAGGVVTGYVEFINRSGRDLVIREGPYELSRNWRLLITGPDGKAVAVVGEHDKYAPIGLVFRDGGVLWKPLLLCRFYGIDVFPEPGTYSVSASALFRCDDMSGAQVEVHADTEPKAVQVKPGGRGREAFRYLIGDLAFCALRSGMEYNDEDAQLCGDYSECYRQMAAYDSGTYLILKYIWSSGRGWPGGTSSKVGFFGDIGTKIEDRLRFARMTGVGEWMWEEIQGNWQNLRDMPSSDVARVPVNVRIGRLLVY